jgi:hypothetical protein
VAAGLVAAGVVPAGLAVLAGLGEGVGVAVRRPPWPRKMAFRKMSANAATTPATQIFEKRSST